MKSRTIIGYKFITSENKSKNGDCAWKLKEWNTFNEELELCKSGFHACLTPKQSLGYIYGDKWVIVEARVESMKNIKGWLEYSGTVIFVSLFCYIFAVIGLNTDGFSWPFKICLWLFFTCLALYANHEARKTFLPVEKYE